MSTLILNKKDVSARLKISIQSVDRLRKSGTLPWLNVGSGSRPTVRFRLVDVEAFEERVRCFDLPAEENSAQ